MKRSILNLKKNKSENCYQNDDTVKNRNIEAEQEIKKKLGEKVTF